MGVRVVAQHFRDVKVLEIELFKDSRGYFLEAFRSDQFEKLGLPGRFLQDSQSRSAKGVLRGLHFQWSPPQGKLIRVTRGTVYFAVVDIRRGSPTHGDWVGMELSEEKPLQVWVPPGFANGFCVLSEAADVQYKQTAHYNRDGESNIVWNDPAIGIAWPIKNPVVSERDQKAQLLSQWDMSPHSADFRYE